VAVAISRNDRRLAEAVAAIYAAAPTPALWPHALQKIADVFGDVGAILIYQRDDGAFATVVSPALETAQAIYDQGSWWRTDIRMERAIAYGYTGNDEAITDRHIANEVELVEHPQYRDFLPPNGLGWFAGTGISPNPRVAAALSVQRARARPPFAETELHTVAMLGRHVENALRLSIRLIDAEVTSLTLGDVLTRLAIGVFLVDGAARVVFSNEAARRLVSPGSEEKTRDNDARDDVAAAISALAGQSGDRIPKPLLVSGRASDQVIALYLLPIVSRPDAG
jgi:PAS domain-containing protein